MADNTNKGPDWGDNLKDVASWLGDVVKKAGSSAAKTVGSFGPAFEKTFRNRGRPKPTTGQGANTQSANYGRSAGSALGSALGDMVEAFKKAAKGPPQQANNQQNAPGPNAQPQGTGGTWDKLVEVLKNPSIRTLIGGAGALGIGSLFTLGPLIASLFKNMMPGKDTLLGQALGIFVTPGRVAQAANVAATGASALGLDGLAGTLGKWGKFGSKALGYGRLGSALLSAGRGIFNAQQTDTSTSPFAAMGGMVRGAGKLANLAVGGGIHGFIIEKALNFVATIMESIHKLREWTKQLHESNMKFAEFSTAMARVQASTEMRDIQFSRDRGEARADSAGTLSRANYRFDRRWVDISDFMANWTNQTGALAMNLLSLDPITLAIKDGMLQALTGPNFRSLLDDIDSPTLNNIATMLEMMLKLLKKDKMEVSGGVGSFILAVGGEVNEADKHGRPPVWR